MAAVGLTPRPYPFLTGRRGAEYYGPPGSSRRQPGAVAGRRENTSATD